MNKPTVTELQSEIDVLYDELMATQEMIGKIKDDEWNMLKIQNGHSKELSEHKKYINRLEEDYNVLENDNRALTMQVDSLKESQSIMHTALFITAAIIVIINVVDLFL